MTARYDATVTRDGRWWMVSIPGLGGLTQAGRLSEAETMAREWIALTLGAPIEDVEVTVTVLGRKFVPGPDDDTPVTLPDGTVLDGEAAEAFARAKIDEARRRGLIPGRNG